MNIIEATQKALECDGYITRPHCNGIIASAFKPTNSHDCYILCGIVFPNNRRRCWNPTADDILSDEWSVITEEDLTKFQEPRRQFLRDHPERDPSSQQYTR